MVKMNSNDLLKVLCTGAHPRKQQSLRLIYQLCEEQQDRGSSDFSIATIGQFSAAVGGPLAAAIRNKTGDDYKALIKIYPGALDGQSKESDGAEGFDSG
jgi:hypothetical protein